jgi:hypothetical protein
LVGSSRRFESPALAERVALERDEEQVLEVDRNVAAA